MSRRERAASQLPFNFNSSEINHIHPNTNRSYVEYLPTYATPTVLTEREKKKLEPLAPLPAVIDRRRKIKKALKFRTKKEVVDADPDAEQAMREKNLFKDYPKFGMKEYKKGITPYHRYYKRENKKISRMREELNDKIIQLSYNN